MASDSPIPEGLSLPIIFYSTRKAYTRTQNSNTTVKMQRLILYFSYLQNEDLPFPSFESKIIWSMELKDFFQNFGILGGKWGNPPIGFQKGQNYNFWYKTMNRGIQLDFPI